MASTYSDLKIELIGTGEQSGTWGTTTNNNLGNDALGEAITGSADVAFSSADVTVTLTDTNASQAARNLRLNLTGTSGGARQLILGSGCQIEKLYLINNGLADAVTVKNTTGTGIAVAAGKSMFVFNNGTNVVDAITQFNGTIALASGVSGVLPIANGGTGTSSTTFTNLTTNVTGTLPIANGGTGSTSTTFVNAATNVTGTLPIANGGTGTTSTTFTNLTTNVTGTLPVANGGTGATTLTSNNVLLGAGTDAVTFVAPGSSGNVLTSNGSTWTSAASSGGGTGTPPINRYHTTNATYTPTANMKYVVVTCIGGGGGSGGGGGGANGNAGGSGQATTFGSLITANGGNGGAGGQSNNQAGGAGGNAGSTSYGAGATAYQLSSTGQNTNSSFGSIVYGNGIGTPSNGNTGGRSESDGQGGNGGQGGFATALIQATTVGASVAVTVGAGGAQGTSNVQGSVGAVGQVRITEFFG